MGNPMGNTKHPRENHLDEKKIPLGAIANSALSVKGGIIGQLKSPRVNAPRAARTRQEYNR